MLQPRVSVIVAHYNYAHFVASALLSVVEQSIDDWELIVVDDCSSEADFDRLKQIVSGLDDARIVLIRNEENLGQIGSAFEGLRIAVGDFVALLDPDDIYEPAFLENMLAALLNPVCPAGVAACEMGVFNPSTGILARHTTGFRMKSVRDGRYDEHAANLLLNGYSDYFPPWKTGWIWAATSGMMFRKPMLEAIRPHRAVTFTRFEADSYCAVGCHMIAGTVFIDQMLSWRGVHDHNTTMNPLVIFNDQSGLKQEFVDTLWQVKLFVCEVILAHPDLMRMSGMALASTVIAHIGNEGAMVVADRNATAKQMLFRYSLGGA